MYRLSGGMRKAWGNLIRKGLRIFNKRCGYLGSKLWRASTGPAQMRNWVPDLARRAPLFEGGGGLSKLTPQLRLQYYNITNLEYYNIVIL